MNGGKVALLDKAALRRMEVKGERWSLGGRDAPLQVYCDGLMRTGVYRERSDGGRPRVACTKTWLESNPRCWIQRGFVSGGLRWAGMFGRLTADSNYISSSVPCQRWPPP